MSSKKSIKKSDQIKLDRFSSIRQTTKRPDFCGVYYAVSKIYYDAATNRIAVETGYLDLPIFIRSDNYYEVKLSIETKYECKLYTYNDVGKMHINFSFLNAFIEEDSFDTECSLNPSQSLIILGPIDLFFANCFHHHKFDMPFNFTLLEKFRQYCNTKFPEFKSISVLNEADSKNPILNDLTAETIRNFKTPMLSLTAKDFNTKFKNMLGKKAPAEVLRIKLEFFNHSVYTENLIEIVKIAWVNFRNGIFYPTAISFRPEIATDFIQIGDGIDFSNYVHKVKI